MAEDLYAVYSMEASGWVIHSSWDCYDNACFTAHKAAQTRKRMTKVVRTSDRKTMWKYEAAKTPAMPNTFTTFYLIWSPTGPTPLRYRHSDRKDADRACQEMAAKHPQQEFYVMEAKARAQTKNVEFVEAEAPEYMPF